MTYWIVCPSLMLIAIVLWFYVYWDEIQEADRKARRRHRRFARRYEDEYTDEQYMLMDDLLEDWDNDDD